MSNAFIPELHDIGKLVDSTLKDNLKKKLGKSWKGHCFTDFDFSTHGLSQPISPSWWGQYHHKKGDESDINAWNDISDSRYKIDLFLLKIADSLASSISRATTEKNKKQSQQEGILKLWNRNFYNLQKKKGNHWAAFRQISDLKTLFNEIQNCIPSNDFLTKYKHNLLLTPEDKYIPRNITSLFTHIELVGKIYRVLRRHSKMVYEQNGSVSIRHNKENAKSVREARGEREGSKIKGKWQARFVKCWIRFPHSFVRLGDINLLRKKEELIRDLRNNYIDEVFFSTSDFIVLFLPMDTDLIGIFKHFLDLGFYVEVEEIKSDLGILSSTLDRKTLDARKYNDQKNLNIQKARDVKIFKKNLLFDYPDEIKQPICDICQQYEGIKKEKGVIREWICTRCLSIRDMGDPFKEYGNEWERERVKVCWFKFSLDQEKLVNWLINTFNEYVDENNFKDPDFLKEEFRPLALQVDFNNEYKEMLKAFWSRFEDVHDMKKPVQDYNELGVFKYSSRSVKDVIEIFIEIFEQIFPDCVNNEHSPINLSLSIANIKYPIRDHWKYFEKEKKSFLNIHYKGIFEDEYTKDEVNSIIEKLIDSEISQNYLYKLIWQDEELRSDIHLAIEVFNNRTTYPQPYELFSQGIRPSRFLNFCRLLKEVEDEQDKAS